MKYDLMGPKKKCDGLTGDECDRDATVVFILKGSLFVQAVFRFYCAEHAEKQKQQEEA